MTPDRPSATARKVALNIVSLEAKPGMDELLPQGLVEATARLLVAEVGWSFDPGAPGSVPRRGVEHFAVAFKPESGGSGPCASADHRSRCLAEEGIVH